MEAHLKVHTSLKSHQNFFEQHARLSVGFVVFACAVLVMYVLQVNALAVKGFQMQDMEESITKLEKENRILERDIAALQASEVLTAKIARLGLTNDGPIEYIKAETTDAFAWGR